MSRNKVDWAKYHNRHSAKSIWVTRLLFCQNDSPMGESFWQKDSLITHILFELCLSWYLAQSTFLLDTLYYVIRTYKCCFPFSKQKYLPYRSLHEKYCKNMTNVCSCLLLGLWNCLSMSQNKTLQGHVINHQGVKFYN